MVLNSDVKQVVCGFFAIKSSINEELSGNGVNLEHGVVVAVGDDVQKITVETEIAIKSIDLEKTKNIYDFCTVGNAILTFYAVFKGDLLIS